MVTIILPEPHLVIGSMHKGFAGTTTEWMNLKRTNIHLQSAAGSLQTLLLFPNSDDNQRADYKCIQAPFVLLALQPPAPTDYNVWQCCLSDIFWDAPH